MPKPPLTPADDSAWSHYAETVLESATGSAPDGEHAEHGFAVWLERDDVVSIARRFDQSAIFGYDGGSFWLVGALVDAKARQIP